MSNYSTWHICIQGLVQGVGFRPFIYNKAMQYELTGWVKNDIDGVHIEISGPLNMLESFYHELIQKPPALSRITQSSVAKLKYQNYQSFHIKKESIISDLNLQLTPDYAVCASCLVELYNSSDRRYEYVFITCSECGPRYSIIRRLPYEREDTVMDEFEMCNFCQQEYEDCRNRRFYAQTNSCSACGVTLTLYDTHQKKVELDDISIFQFIKQKWDNGDIVAIKGIGGYLLTCSASHVNAIKKLRKRKHRPDKPFALMYPNIESLATFNLSQEQIGEYKGLVAPILLIDKSASHLHSITPGICDNQSHVGIMLPYAPLFHVLLHHFNAPIVATSGNVSNSPIVFQDDEALTTLIDIADFILHHNREIVVPQDDSVVVYSNRFRQRVIIRRSRGLAPSYYHSELKLNNCKTLSMGADMKSTCALHVNENIYISQYIGDLSNYYTQLNYRHTINHLSSLLKFRPQLILADAHPQYESSLYGTQLAHEMQVPIVRVQHHIAHFAAILGEHVLLESEEAVLGVIWDGTGWGEDDAIWGSEFFIYQDYNFRRCAHLDYYPQIVQDKMSREPRIAARSICECLPDVSFLKNKFSDTEWNIYNRMLEKENLLLSSSMGRVFDTVASILGLCDIQSYEGQAAAMLQAKAEGYLRECNYKFDYSYFASGATAEISMSQLLSDLLEDINDGMEGGFIAAKFHVTLVDWIAAIAVKERVKKLAFSGGVFQNTLLLDLIKATLGESFEIFFHKELSPNDENISFGQLIYAEIESKRYKNSTLF